MFLHFPSFWLALGLGALIVFRAGAPRIANSLLCRWPQWFILAGYLLYLLNILISFTGGDFLKFPISQLDYITHYIDGVDSATFITQTGRMWGYNPYFSAGYISGIFVESDNHWAILMLWLFSHVANNPLVFNATIFCTYALLPLIALRTARAFGFGRPAIVQLTLFSMLLVMGFRPIRSFYYWGGYSFIFSCFLSFYLAGHYKCYLEEKTLKNMVLVVLVGAFAFFVHPLSSVIFLCLFATISLAHTGRFSVKDICFFIAGLGAVVLLNTSWIIPWIKFRGLASSLFSCAMQTTPSLLWETLGGSKAFLVMILSTLWALGVLVRARRFHFLLMFGAAALYFLLAFFGTQLGAGIIRPTRFIIPFGLTAIFILTEALDQDQALIARWLSGLASAALCLLLILPPVRFEAGYARFPEVGQLSNFLKQNAEVPARCHMQDSFGQPYFKSYFSAMLPALSGMQSCAAAYPFPMTDATFLQFVDNHLFGKELTSLGEQELSGYLKLYNIRYLLVFSGTAHRYFDGMPSFKQAFSTGTFAIYEFLNASNNFCSDCSAQVSADYNRIRVRTGAPEITLKYHYFKSLHTIPPVVVLEPVYLLDDPTPFIRVHTNNCQSFDIID